VKPTRQALRGRVALVTGGASGIGLACARALRLAGARVALVDADANRLAALRRSFEARDLYPADVSDAESARQTVDDLVRRRRGLDLLVVAAGVCRDAVLWKMTDEQWDRVIAVDLSGAGNFLRAAAQALRKSAAGRVVLISSINGRRGKFGQANYAAAKAGLVGLARSAARELAASRVTVNVVEPGFTETPMTARLPAEVRRRALAETPLGRTALPEDIAALVVFLAGPGAAHITGQAIAVDGGQALGT
jgi:NAD(P)-dependent dehydrogenase (short-subunit alcohol dehydrogenase family)